MTEPAAETVDLLVTPAELEVWVQEPAGSLATDVFTLKVLWATSVLIRDVGNENWTYDTIPERAKVIAELVAKNYWLHPEGVIADTTGPITERFIAEVVHNMELTAEQTAIIERLAKQATTPSVSDFGDLQVLSTTRGPLEVQHRGRRPTVYIRDAHGSAIGYYDPVDSFAYTPLAELGYE